MTYTGLIILMVLAVIAVYVTPALIRLRQHKVDNPVEDRFSEGITVVDVSRVCPRVFGESARSQPLLLPNSKVDLVNGDWSEAMVEATARPLKRRKVAKTAETEKQLAKVRAERKNRLAAEAVAGQRRFVIAAFALTFLVAFTVATVYGSLNTWWLTAPSSVLLGTLISGRAAYQKSQQASANETAAMRRIRETAEKERRRKVQARIRSTEVTTGSITLGDQQVALPVAETIVAVEVAEIVETQVETVVSAQEQAHREAQNALVGNKAKGAQRKEQPNAQAQTMLDVLPTTTVSGKSAVVRRRATPLTTSVSAPTVSGRRPVSARPMPVDAASSTELAQEAAARKEAALDLEQILQQRRAQ
ncbi:hypothetical protein [Gleimia coleocanis]|uniref:hypothetical protein n=1 Tax=Gleimia coleocanis TaxID=103618 RepID=UPI0002D98B11|nr:hypothetical protein [Gleimia coleocanis]